MDEPARRLLEVAERVTPVWARRLVGRVFASQTPAPAARIDDTVATVTAMVKQGLQELFSQDPEAQRSNPLTIFRQATTPITELAASLGVPPVRRDEFETRSFPDDLYGLCPATWADISEDLVEPGLEWGAWKAAVIIYRHR